MSGAPATTAAQPGAVLRLGEIDHGALARLLQRYGLELALLPRGEPIPGSYWGDSEAGLRGARLYARADTPVHSVLHEGGHYICMDPQRRARLDRDAGGDDLEEAAVCYLQLLLAGRARRCRARAPHGRHGRVGLQLPAGQYASLVRRRRGRCTALAPAAAPHRCRRRARRERGGVALSAHRRCLSRRAAIR